MQSKNIKMAAQQVQQALAPLPYLDGTNFGNWLFRVQTLMEEKECRDAVDCDSGIEGIYRKMKEDANFKRQNAKAKQIIVNSLKDKHLEYVRECGTAMEMIENLRKMFETKSTLSKLYLRQKLLTLKHKPELNNLEDHFNTFDKIIRELEIDKKMDETDKVCHLLLSIDNSAYQPVITALEATNMELTLEYVKRKLLDAELKYKNTSKLSPVQNECSFTGEVRKCFTCGDPKHFMKDCPKGIKGQGRGNFRGRFRGRGRSQRKTFPVASVATKNNFGFVAVANNVEDSNRMTLVLDSGATYNMVDEKYIDFMEDITEIEEVNVKVANGQIMKIRKQGKLRFKTEEDKILTMEALIVENLSHNLMSVRRLNNKGCSVLFRKDVATIKTPNHGVFRARSNGSLYTLNAIPVKLQASLTVTEDNMLWHRRLGHLNHAGLKMLGLPNTNEKCDICMQAKGTRNSFQNVPFPRTKKIGDLIYCDIGGPLTPNTKDDERYYLTIIDDHSHFTEVYLLKTKSEAANYIIEYMRRMKNQGNHIIRLRTDNGGEFQVQELKDYCKKNGIKQEFTCAYTPQQNGVAERMNRTLMNKVRALLLESNLPKELWGEALRCATYQLNRSPTVTLKGNTPANIMFGKIKLHNLVVFGSKAWVINLPKRGKLEPKATEMRMVSYSGNGYRLWNPQTNQIVISRDVRFDEREFKYNNSDVQPTPIYVHMDEYNEETAEENIDEKQESSDTVGRCIYEENNIRPKRNITLPSRYEDYELNLAYALISDGDPLTYEEAIEQGQMWIKAIDKEVNSLENLKVWKECHLPQGKKAIETKWVFRTKQDGSKKARLVVKGFQQESNNGLDIYSPVAKLTTIRLLLSQAINNNWEIRQLDIPTAFLNGTLDSEVYIKIPEGVNIYNKEKVLKLQKALYGLKEAPKCWNETLNKFCENIDMKRSKYDMQIGQETDLIARAQVAWSYTIVTTLFPGLRKSKLQSLYQLLKQNMLQLLCVRLNFFM
ncbi:hypothetical protein O3G_MSEX004231 [Manduca sexta]|uniref:Uncharacterized protein n=1 Tax=Manduca sexta TaxID=7130 RepID=A0A921YU66_MANSE|nr:hypothetical protein O3G_MSEX004231 [Manduca sexta]